MTTTLSNKHYSGHHKFTEKDESKKYPKKDLQKDMWTEGFKYSWRKMKVAEQDRDGWREVICGLCSISQVTEARKTVETAE